MRRNLRTIASRKIVEEKIKSTHGFTYDGHLQPLLCHTLGALRVLAIERELERDGSLSRLKGNLGLVKNARREAAHTFTSGTTSRFQAPSITRRQFEQTEPIVLRLWELVRA